MANVRDSIGKMSKVHLIDVIADVAIYLSFQQHTRNKDLAHVEKLEKCLTTLESLKNWRTKKSLEGKMKTKEPLALTNDMLFDPVAQEEVNKSGRGVKIKKSPPKKQVKKKTKRTNATHTHELTQDEIEALLSAISDNPPIIGSDSLEELSIRDRPRRRQSFYSRTRSRHIRIRMDRERKSPE